ncbi:MAG: hypothetical protein HY223_05210 [Thaumarchaeota archaeon]|nr:hypothetical protein [Nitrososphaerota archaeon]
MIDQELQELEDKEIEKLDKLIDKVVDNINSGKKLTPLDFYPEIASFVKGKTYTNWLVMHRPILLQLPFYDVTLMPIFPLNDEKIFEKETGLTVQQTLELYKEGKILPLLQFPPLEFRGLDYLDPILELNLPILNFRQPAYDHALSINVLGHDQYQISTWYEEGMEIFKIVTSDKLNKFPESLTSLLSKDAQTDSDFIRNIGYAYARLMLMGYSDLVSILLSLKNPMTIAQSLWIYEKVLTAKHHLSLGGVVSWDTLDALAAKNLGIDSAKAFPIDVGKLLIKEFELVSIRDFGFEKIIKITNSTAKPRKALFALDEAVELHQEEKIIDRSLALRETWEETNEIVRSMNKSKDKITKFIPLSIGLVGGLSTAFNTLPGIISTILGIAGCQVIAEPLTEFILKLGKPTHIVSIFDLSKEIHRN